MLRSRPETLLEFAAFWRTPAQPLLLRKYPADKVKVAQADLPKVKVPA